MGHMGGYGEPGRLERCPYPLSLVGVGNRGPRETPGARKGKVRRRQEPAVLEVKLG